MEETAVGSGALGPSMSRGNMHRYMPRGAGTVVYCEVLVDDQIQSECLNLAAVPAFEHVSEPGADRSRRARTASAHARTQTIGANILNR